MQFNENLTVEEWTGNNELAINIFNNKYKYGNETFMETIDRISGGKEEIKQLILEKKFLPGGRICANRGINKYDPSRKVSLSNCYVMPYIEDNLESIFDTAKMLARTYSMGGGAGICVSKLAFNGAKVRNAANESSGAVSFMDLYSMVTGLISQNGRRGALMISMEVSHPDIEEFIEVKNDLTRVTKANISVKISDEFMIAVKEDKDFDLKFTREETGETKVKTVRAKELFRKICMNAWNMAEPGVLFWDRIKNYNLCSDDKEFELVGTNPCGELPLPAGGACLLGSLNLSAFIKDPFTKNASFDFKTFENVVETCIEELDCLIDEGLEGHPLQIQKDTAAKWRPIGLGIMGLADMLIKMGITYGSKQAIDLCDAIGFLMSHTAILTSNKMAKGKGPFPACKTNSIIGSEFYHNNANWNADSMYINQYGLRNAQLLTIAPTGSLSNVLGISGGIEPIFANSYTRKTESLHGEDTYYKVYTPIVKEYMDKFGIDKEEDLPEYFITAQNIPYEDRVKMQGIWQTHIDNSISSTVNLPESATVEDIEDLYMKAWENGLKGITVYRDNCSRTGILTVDKKEETVDSEVPVAVQSETYGPARGEVIKVSNDVTGLKRKLMTGCGSLHCTAFFDNKTGDLVETYLSKGSTGGCNNFMVGLSRMISLSARLGGNITDIIDQLKSTGVCPSYAVRKALHNDTSLGSCCPMAVGNALLEMYNEFNSAGTLLSEKDIVEKAKTYVYSGPTDTETAKSYSLSEELKCPQCGSKLDHEGGCDICRDCGWTRCD